MYIVCIGVCWPPAEAPPLPTLAPVGPDVPPMKEGSARELAWVHAAMLWKLRCVLLRRRIVDLAHADQGPRRMDHPVTRQGD